jgi:chemotaxis protein MotA
MANAFKLKSAGRRPDLATVLGLAIAATSLIGGLILEGGKVADVRQLTAALMVLGGTTGAVLISTPFPLFLSALRRLGGLVMSRPQSFAVTMETILHLAERARRNGISSLEPDKAGVQDRYLEKLLNLAADGVDLRDLRQMMLLDSEISEMRAEAEAKVWESAAGYAPTVGIIGAVLGLIQVMKHLENLDAVGKGIAVAFVATVYGVASANILFLPVASKLKKRSQEVAQLQEMMLEGVVSIAEGMNPRLIAVKLEPFRAQARRQGKDGRPD